MFVFINATLLPFLWGDRSLRDSSTIPSIYATGSRNPAAARQPVLREFDPGASAWQTEPWFAFEHDVIFREHVAPLWNPYSAFGTPLAANMQSQLFSPFAWIPILSKSPRTFDIFIAFRIYAGGVFALLFLRLFVPLWPAMVGASSFMYAGYFWLFITSPQISAEVALPAMLLGVELVLRRPNAFRTGCLACAFALGIVGGMPEALLLALATVFSYATYRVVAESRFRHRLFAGTTAILVAFALGAGVSAVALLPFFEYLPLSFNVHSGTLMGLTSDSWSWPAMVTYLSPMGFGPPLSDIFTGFAGWTGVRGFFGMTTTFLALLAISIRAGDLGRKRRSSWPLAFFAIVALICVSKRFGLPWVNWLGALPGFRLVTFVKYEEAELAFAIAVLAAFGAAALIERRVTLIHVAFAAAGPILLIQLAFGPYFREAMSLPQHRQYFFYSLLCSVVALALAALLCLARDFWKNRRLPATIALLVLLVVEMHASYVIPLFYIIDGEPVQSADALDGAPYLKFLKDNTLDGTRFLGRDGILFPNWSTPYALRDVRDVDALYDRHYLLFARALLEPGGTDLQDRFTGLEKIDLSQKLSQRFLQMSSICFVGVPGASSDPAASLPNPFRRAFNQQGVEIFRYGNALPRLSIFRSVLNVSGDAEALSTVASATFDPTREAVVEGMSSSDVLKMKDEDVAPVIAGTLSIDSSRFVEGSFTTPSRAVVVLNDTFYPGWSAKLDGRPARVYRANFLFRGVVVGRGKHTITFNYEPLTFRFATIVSIASALFVGVLLWVARIESFVRSRARRRLSTA